MYDSVGPLVFASNPFYCLGFGGPLQIGSLLNIYRALCCQEMEFSGQEEEPSVGVGLGRA